MNIIGWPDICRPNRPMIFPYFSIFTYTWFGTELQYIYRTSRNIFDNNRTSKTKSTYMHVALFSDWKNIKTRGFYCGEHCNLNECIVDNLMLQWAPDRSWSNILCTSLTYIYYHTMLWNTNRKCKFWDERISSKKSKSRQFLKKKFGWSKHLWKWKRKSKDVDLSLCHHHWFFDF